MTSGSSVDPSPSPRGLPSVAVAVLATEGMQLDQTLTALSQQVYAPSQILIVGQTSASVAGNDITSVASPDAVVGQLGPEIGFVWWIHGDTRPRPDALKALVRETLRNDAAVGGSKILVEGSLDELDSVGGATDVFGEPYTGLDAGELDLEQYDVVREVAFVSPVSLLVRKDLLKGLGGLDPALPAQAAGLDISQRARLAGGKVIVVPSSEAFHPRDCPAAGPDWKEQAGRQKAMLVAYKPLTLAWVLPVGFLTGLVDGLGQILVGRLRPLLATMASWAWTLAQVPSIFGARRRLARIRQMGDEELFRFQVSGSTRLRQTASELSDRFNRAIDEEAPDSIAEKARDAWEKPHAALILISVLAGLMATRSIWITGLPEAGFSLSPGGVGGPASSYGGAWNPAGLGSGRAAPPIVALGWLADLIVGRSPGLAGPLLTLAAVAAGLVGMTRLVRRTGSGSAAGVAAGWVFMAGAGAGAVFAAGHWPALLSAGAVPWALDAVLAPPGADWRRRLGRYARGGLAAGLVTACYPPMLVIVPIGAVVWAIVARRPGSVMAGLSITALGAGLVAPFVISGDLTALLAAGSLPSIRPEWFWVVSICLAVAVPALLVSRARLPAVWLGGVLAAGGWLIVRIPNLLPGAGVVALIGASLGAGILCAAAFEVRSRLLWARSLAIATGAMLLLPVIVNIAGGRAALAADEWSGRLEFVSVLDQASDAGRVLLIGPPDSLPGASRSIYGLSYRVVDGSDPKLEQAYLPTPGPADVALAQTISRSLLEGADLRPGAALSRFGIHWVVILPGTDFPTEALDRQLDLALRPVQPDLTVYENLVKVGRAVDQSGTDWTWDGSGFVGPARGGIVRLAVNPDNRWGPQGAMTEGWAQTVSAATGRAVYRFDSLTRTAGWAAVALAIALAIMGFWGRAIAFRPMATEPKPEPITADLS